MAEGLLCDPHKSYELYLKIAANINRNTGQIIKDLTFDGVHFSIDMEKEIYDIIMNNQANVRGTILEIAVDKDLEALRIRKSEAVIIEPTFKMNSQILKQS